MNRLSRFLFLAAGLAACGDAAAPIPPTRTRNAGVEIFDNSFSPTEVAIVRGEHVTWLWRGTGRHSIRFFGASTAAHSDTAGGIYDRAFDNPGVYDYYCSFHGSAGTLGVSGMSGRVTVN